ncbi:MAG: hypothetical protein KDC05_01035 [Bacteroidales bacterium]|nr:hypothetical protein [Bacteroidales bacterium]
MNRKKLSVTSKDFDEEIKIYIKKKKEENQALKKLLAALENSKKDSDLVTFHK